MRRGEEGLNSRRARERSEHRGNEFMSSSKERAGRLAGGKEGLGLGKTEGAGMESWVSAVCKYDIYIRRVHVC